MLGWLWWRKGSLVGVQTSAGKTWLLEQNDIDGVRFTHVKGPRLDEEALDELREDMARLDANSHGVPIRPRHWSGR